MLPPVLSHYRPCDVAYGGFHAGFTQVKESVRWNARRTCCTPDSLAPVSLLPVLPWLIVAHAPSFESSIMLSASSFFVVSKTYLCPYGFDSSLRFVQALRYYDLC